MGKKSHTDNEKAKSLDFLLSSPLLSYHNHIIGIIIIIIFYNSLYIFCPCSFAFKSMKILILLLVLLPQTQVT